MVFRRALLLLASSLTPAFSAAPPSDLDKQFAQTVRPFLATYCVSCHGAANPAAQFDLVQYTAVSDVVRDHHRWALVAEKLVSGEMPPKAMKQPTAELRQQVQHWVEAIRQSEARKNAGDPGLVLVRRLSNAEYNNSIRDLTGHDLRPAREFPVDPSNSAGFDNSGESLSMSPALLNKYLQAAREVANNLVLRPIGIAFAPHPMLAETDREKYTIQRIVDFYDRQPTDFADYFQAAWRYKHRVALEKSEATLESLAKDAKLSPKYLPMVWSILEEAQEDVGPVPKLQSMWKRLPKPEHNQPELVREGCAKMREYVLKIRKLTARQFRSPRLQGISGTSQPLMNWKLRAYASHRRDFDQTALQVEGDPPPQMPLTRRNGGVPSEDDVAVRNTILALKARAGEPELFVPAGQREPYEKSFARFASVFPDAFYIRERGRFYPDDSEDKGRLLSAGFHNVMGYFRDDTPLQELILDDAGIGELDLLWLEFDTVADFTTRTYTQFFFNQSGEIDGRGRESGSFRPGDTAITSEKVIFGIRDTYLAAAETRGDELTKEAIREHFARVNATIRTVEKARVDAEPTHLNAMLAFASKAFRRPLTADEQEGFRRYYRDIREKQGLNHEDAMRDMVVLILMSPDFCYRVEAATPQPPPVSQTKTAPSRRAKATPAPVEKSKPLNGYALATRLAYYLWSTLPDETLRKLAESGEINKPEVLKTQIKRMLQSPKSRALATEFAGNWLEFRRFEDHNSVDRTRFPVFTNDLRQAMFEEPVRYMDDIIRNDRSALDVLYGKHTFVNRVLAEHYGMGDRRPPAGKWIRIDDATPFGRGGILPMAAFLTRNSPGLRTSPVKRGFWVAKTVLGEHIPPPPPNVPELPGDESKMDLPLRQMLAKHRENPSCAGCHQRFDGFGLAFESYGPVGERRAKDLAGRPVDTASEFPNGSPSKGLDDLLVYIKEHREKDFIDNLCRKMLVYALGRSLQLSDELLIDELKQQFIAAGHRFSTLIESIVISPQFRNQRAPELFSSTQTGSRKAE
ncbi:MAG: DUF1592 domain-containing protein [Bryobacterales bacterium]|nr:DUF1592 domain-containing protein [Bryobacterales bacterium]